MIARTLSEMAQNRDFLVIGAVFVLILFFSIFTAACAWVIRPGAAQKYEELRKLPLEGQ